MNNKYKIILAIAFVLSLLIGARYSYGQTSTTTVTVNGNTTTTTTITNTPISTTSVSNTPNIGDITTTTVNQTTTDIMTKVANTNTGNLLTGNFCIGGWTGTQITSNPAGQTSDLGCAYLTGKGTSSYAENSKDLLSVGISKAEQNLGFTQSANAQTGFYWSNAQNLTFSQSAINNDTGETITQNRTYSKAAGAADPNYMTTKYLDNIIIGANSASGYTSKIRFDFSSSGGGATWQGADITQPKLSITYTTLNTSTTTGTITETVIIPCESLGTCYTPPVIEQPKISLTTSGQTIDEQIKSIPYSNSITGEVYGMTPPTINTEISVIKPQATETLKMENQATNTALTGDPSKTTTTTTETTTATKSEATTSTVMTKEEPKTLTKESNATTSSDKETTSVSEKTNTVTDTKSEESKTTTSQSATNENQKAEGPQTEKANEKVVSDKSVTTNEKGTANVGVNSIEAKVKTAIEKVEREVKSIDQKTRAIQEIKLEGLKSGAPNLSVYENKNFYDPRQMVGTPNPDFFNQINIQQQQIYKDVSLSAYTNRDPIAVKQALQMEIEEEMNKLILEIEILKRS